MKNYDLSYSFDENLREVFNSSEDVKSYINDQLKKLSNINEPTERAKILGILGVYSRILYDLESANEYLSEAMNLIDQHNLDLKLWLVNGIRLAHVYQWMREFEIAEEMFQGIEEVCELKEEVSGYLHFTYQHMGKFHFDLKEYDIALEYFEDALEIRNRLGDKSLIESTKYAISITRIFLGEEYES